MDRARSNGALGLDLRFVGAVVARTLLPLWFILSSSLTLYQFASQNLLGIDARLYRFAAIRALSGGDPWAVHADGTAFAGPPPTLLLYLPSALLPEVVSTVLIVGHRARRRDLGGPQARAPAVVAVLPAPLRGRHRRQSRRPGAGARCSCPVRCAGVAAGLKVYALIPLALARRWTALAVASRRGCREPAAPARVPGQPPLGVDRPRPADGPSAAPGGPGWSSRRSSPWWPLRRRGAEWLVVPALWPNTQRHYAAMSLPAVRTVADRGGPDEPGAPAGAGGGGASTWPSRPPGRTGAAPRSPPPDDVADAAARLATDGPTRTKTAPSPSA